MILGNDWKPDDICSCRRELTSEGVQMAAMVDPTKEMASWQSPPSQFVENGILLKRVFTLDRFP